MIAVKIGEFRNQLSRYLKQVRKGAIITITDRETPIGQVVPFQKKGADELVMIPAPRGFEGLAHFQPPVMGPKDFSAVEELVKDRGRR